jgi:D-serine deaminase-like pyridoxal phosphate-dependent protein
MSTIDHLDDPRLEPFRDAVGRGVDELATPALLLDLDIVEANIATMAERFGQLAAELRPHIKVHKCVELARRQCAAGAIGVACATVWEATVMARGGIEDVLVANQVVGPEKQRALAEAAREHRLTVVVDDARNVRALDAAAAAAGSRLEVLIEVDVGMGRCGVADAGGALALAREVAASEHLVLRGLQGYEGHCMLEPDPVVRRRETGVANAKVVGVADALAAEGLASAVVSAGGTGTYFITGACAGITEVQAGSYALMDAFHEALVPGGFRIGMTVLATVVSRRGSTIVLDCGRKSVGIDFVSPPLRDHPGVAARYYAEEHALFDFDGIPPLDIGETAEIVAGYGPTTVNLHDAFHVVRGGEVVDVWPVTPRGPARPYRR